MLPKLCPPAPCLSSALPFFTDVQGFWPGFSSFSSLAECWEQTCRPADRQKTERDCTVHGLGSLSWIWALLILQFFPYLSCIPATITFQAAGTRPGCFPNYFGSLLSSSCASNQPHPYPFTWGQLFPPGLRVWKGIIFRICLSFTIALQGHTPHPRNFRLKSGWRAQRRAVEEETGPSAHVAPHHSPHSSQDPLLSSRLSPLLLNPSPISFHPCPGRQQWPPSYWPVGPRPGLYLLGLA